MKLHATRYIAHTLLFTAILTGTMYLPHVQAEEVTNCKDAITALTPGQPIPQSIRDKCRIDETKLQSSQGSGYEELKETFVPIMEAEQRASFQFYESLSAEEKKLLEEGKVSEKDAVQELIDGTHSTEGKFTTFPSLFNTQFWKGMNIETLFTLFLKMGDGAQPIFPITAEVDPITGTTFVTKTFLDMVRAKATSYMCASWNTEGFGRLCAENPFTGLRADAHLREDFNNPYTNKSFVRVTAPTTQALNYLGVSGNNQAPAYFNQYPRNWTWSKTAQYCHLKGGRLPTVEEALFFLSAKPSLTGVPRWSLTGEERQYIGAGQTDRSYFVLTGDVTYIPWSEPDNVNIIGIRVPYYTSLGTYGTPQWTDITTLNSKEISNPSFQLNSTGTGLYANRVVWYCVYD